MLNDYPDVLTAEQVAQILRISKNSAYKLLHQRVIGSLSVGRKFLVPKSALRAYLESAKYKASHL